MALNLFEERIEELISEIKGSPTTPGFDEIFLPGEVEYNAMQEGLKTGIKLNENIRNNLNLLAETLNINEKL